MTREWNVNSTLFTWFAYAHTALDTKEDEILLAQLKMIQKHRTKKKIHKNLLYTCRTLKLPSHALNPIDTKSKLKKLIDWSNLNHISFPHALVVFVRAQRILTADWLNVASRNIVWRSPLHEQPNEKNLWMETKSVRWASFVVRTLAARRRLMCCTDHEWANTQIDTRYVMR